MMTKSRKQLIREHQRKKRTKWNLVWGVLALTVLSAVGLLVWQGTRPAVGEVVSIPADYLQHIAEGEDPGPFPSNPPAGGRHYSSEFEAGFYDETSLQAQSAYPEGYIGHNLEHGYVVFWYNCSLINEGDCETLKSEIKSVMNDFDGIKLIAFPWPSLDVPVAMTSWGRLQHFESFDKETAAAFIRNNRNKAPEPNAP